MQQVPRVPQAQPDQQDQRGQRDRQDLRVLLDQPDPPVLKAYQGIRVPLDDFFHFTILLDTMPLVRLIPNNAYRDLPQGTTPTSFSRSIILEAVKRYSGNNLKADDRRMLANIVEAVDDAIAANPNSQNVDLNNAQIIFLKTCFSSIQTTVEESFNYYQFERALP